MFWKSRYRCGRGLSPTIAVVIISFLALALALVPLALFAALGGLVIALILATNRRLGMWQPSEDRVTYTAFFPRDTSHQALLNFTRHLNGLGRPRLVVDVYCDWRGFVWYFTAPRNLAPEIRAMITTHMPGSSVLPATDDLVASTYWQAARQLRTTTARTPFQIDLAEATAANLLSKFGPLAEDQAAVMQWIIYGSHHTRQTTTKQPEHGFIGLVRLAATGEDSWAVVDRLYRGLASAHGNGTRFADYLYAGRIAERVSERAGALLYEARVRADELTAFLGIPTGEPNVAGLPPAKARHLPPDRRLPSPGPDRVTVGASTDPTDTRLIALPIADLPKHLHLQGKTGTGKSQLIINIMAQLFEQGHGGGVLDPAGDLIDDLLPLIPRDRVRDVILFDPTDPFPVPFNIFAGTNRPSVVADQVMAIFAGIYPSSAAITTNNYLRPAIQTLASVPGMTLLDVIPLLTDDAFLGRIIGQLDNKSLVEHWGRYRLMKPGERSTLIAPVMHRVQPLFFNDAVRLTLGQSENALDMRDILANNKILLARLPKGLIGDDTAKLFGSLIFTKGFQAAQARSKGDRKQWILALDEAQNFLHTPLSIETVLAESRKYGYGLIIAHQWERQMASAASAIDTARHHVFFETTPDDARSVARLMEPYAKPADASNLGRYQAIIQATVNDETLPPATIATLPPMPKKVSADLVRATSRSQWGRSASAVEREIAARQQGYRKGDQGEERPGREELA